jgi:hypothetical protein
MISALISRSRARHIRKFELVSCPLIDTQGSLVFG